MKYVIREPLALIAAGLVVLTAAIVTFPLVSHLPESNLIVGLGLVSLLPVLAVAGAAIFYLAIRSEGFRGE